MSLQGASEIVGQSAATGAQQSADEHPNEVRLGATRDGSRYPPRRQPQPRLDYARIEACTIAAYRACAPFPWMEFTGLVREDAYAELRASLPPPELFERSFGLRRWHGQQPHDRYVLEYRRDLPVAPVWHEFVAELCAERYRRHLCALLEVERVTLNFHWHYTPAGCAISPHTDSTRKAGSQIFYFNSNDDWDPAWGGQTLLLEPRKPLRSGTAPTFDGFNRVGAVGPVGNRSLLFSRTDRSWHGMEPLMAPADRLRRVFIVVINHDRAFDRVRRVLSRRRVQVF